VVAQDVIAVYETVAHRTGLARAAAGDNLWSRLLRGRGGER
jgi:hypothetical protein